MVESKKERSGIRVDYKIESVIGKYACWILLNFHLEAPSPLLEKAAIGKADKR
jgi:hypothetical protein